MTDKENSDTPQEKEQPGFSTNENKLDLITSALSELKKPKSKIEKFLQWINPVLTLCMIVVTGLLVHWASKQWEAAKEQANAAKEQAVAAKEQAVAAEKQATAATQQVTAAEQSLNLERSKSKAKLECRMWERRLFVTVSDYMAVSDFISASITDSTGVHKRADTSTKDDHTQVAPKQTDTNTNKPASINTSSEDDRTEVILICLNNSSRSTAVIDVYLRDKNGNHLGRIPRGYNNQIKLPFPVASWGVTPLIDFRIEKEDDKKMKDIFIMDMDDKAYVILCPSTRPGQKE